MDNIEKKIREHRGEFDVDFPGKLGVWDAIEQQMAPKKTIPLWKNHWIQFAAAACMAGVITLFALKNGQERQTNTICSINGVSKDFCMQVNDYESNIQQKLSSFNSNETSIPKEVEEEITLDSPMKVVLLNELKKHPDNPKIKEAILKYYKAKLELIQRIEELLKKQDKTMNDETDNSTVI
ncbi:MAG: hypothetical protein U0X41_06030 [Chitinophagales bacterium]|jgi:hypothetical protein